MRRLLTGLAMAAAIIAAPATGQRFSNSYSFLKAVKDRDGAKVQEYLSAPGSVVINSRDQASGEGGLHVVVKGRDLTWLSYLLGKGARTDIQDRNGDSPLSLAAQIGWVEGAQLLIDRKAPVDQTNNRGETALIKAVQRRDVQMVRMLLAAGADPKREDSAAGYSALDYAKADPRAVTIVRLIEEGPATKRREVSGPTL